MIGRIFRYEVPVDDEWHKISGCSAPLFVTSRQFDVVEFWAWDRPDLIGSPSEYRVFGTGHPVDEDAEYVDSAVTPGGQLVWHLVRRR